MPIEKKLVEKFGRTRRSYETHFICDNPNSTPLRPLCRKIYLKSPDNKNHTTANSSDILAPVFLSSTPQSLKFIFGCGNTKLVTFYNGGVQPVQPVSGPAAAAVHSKK